MIERALKARVPFAWVTADSVYGDASRLRQTLVAARRSYVLAVLSSQRWGWPRQTVATLARALPTMAWRTLSCGAGAKGPRLYQWAYLPGQPEEGCIKGVLVRRHRRRHRERAYYLTYAPVGTPFEKLVEIAGSRWTIESGFEQAKSEVGLDQYEVRRYDAWYRHITLALLAHAYLAVVRAQGAGKKYRPGTVASALAADRPRDPSAAGGLGAGETHPARRHHGLVKVATPVSTAGQALPLGRSHPAPT